jgi:ribosome-associated protein
MLRITSSISIPESEITFDFTPSSGPGGQNVNKVATAVRLTFDAGRSPSLPVMVKERLKKLAGTKMTSDGILILIGRRYRTQERNRVDVTARFTDLMQKAAKRPKKRIPTHPGIAAKEKRMENKKRQGEKKSIRKTVIQNGE